MKSSQHELADKRRINDRILSLRETTCKKLSTMSELFWSRFIANSNKKNKAAWNQKGCNSIEYKEAHHGERKTKFNQVAFQSEPSLNIEQVYSDYIKNVSENLEMEKSEKAPITMGM